MPRYIDADALKQDVGSYNPVKYTYEYGYVITVEDIDNAPTADVVEVKHGEWFIGKDIFGNGFMNCSECHCDVDVEFDEPDEVELFKYCPHCGAKMDGKETEHD